LSQVYRVETDMAREKFRAAGAISLPEAVRGVIKSGAGLRRLRN